MKNYRITVNGKTYDVTVEETGASAPAAPVAAAATGEIDDVILVSELRCRIASALLMLSAKGTVDAPDRAIRPL